MQSYPPSRPRSAPKASSSIARISGRAARVAALLGFFGAGGCELFVAPPEPYLFEAQDGVLTNPGEPLILAFTKPVDPDTVAFKIARRELDIEGNLPDADGNPDTELDSFIERSKVGHAHGATIELYADDQAFAIHPNSALPIGTQLVMIVEPGLAGRDGAATADRRIIPFGYTFELACDRPTTFKGGTYFFLVDVLKPIAAQVQLFASVDVDPETGSIRVQFTNADRDMTAGRCPFECKSTEACRLLPEPECVVPSTKAGSVDEFSDFVPNAQSPSGYSFFAPGCVQDQGEGSWALSFAPVDVVLEIPPVTLRNARLTAAFALDAQGVARGSGALTADDVLLGESSSGRGEGGLVSRNVPEGEEPAGIPAPPPRSPAD